MISDLGYFISKPEWLQEESENNLLLSCSKQRVVFQEGSEPSGQVCGHDIWQV